MNHAFQEEEYDSKFSLKMWSKLSQYFLLVRKQLIIMSIVIIVIAVLDVTFPILNKIIIDDYIKSSNKEGLKLFFVIYLSLFLIQAVNIFLFIKSAGKVEVEMAYQLRKSAFKKLQELSFSYYDKTPVGWIMARLTSDIRKISEILSWGLIDLLWGFLMMVGIAIVMFIYNAKLALIALSVVPIIFVISVYFRKKILVNYRKVRKINSQITGSFNEGIQGAITTKTLVIEDKNVNEFGHLIGNMRSRSIKVAVLSSAFFPIVLALGYVGTSLSLYFGGNGVINGTIEIGVVAMFITFSTLFFEPVLQIARILAEMQHAQASVERLFSLLDTDAEISDTPEVIDKYGDLFNYKKENWEPLEGEIKFENVTFKYKDGEKVLDSFDLNVKKGETIALVGETGAGKSTIVNLICRFYEPSEGRILIDGKDYKERSIGWLHNNLGYVLQTPQLFNGTIKDNIKYGHLDATDEDIIKAAKVVNAHEFIEELENGYDTEIGQSGNRLSTGQKQLISFARAILANPAILILDEATSSIDTETERVIQHAIDKLLHGRTSFIVAHRLSTIVNADRILVLRKGKILEEGSHSELINKRGYYYNLYTNQFVEEKTHELGL